MHKILLGLLLLVLLANCGPKKALDNHVGPWDPLGTYTLSGTDLSGNDYEGTLRLTPFGNDGYKAVWVVGTAFSGVGVWIDGLLVIGFGNGCGGGLYRLPEEGRMYGIFMSPEGEAFKERADAKKMETDMSGIWLVRGVNIDGSRYSAYLNIQEEDNLYRAIWKGKETEQGIGMIVDDHLTMAYGSPACGLAVFERQADGSLAGQWIRGGLRGMGVETARAK